MIEEGLFGALQRPMIEEVKVLTQKVYRAG